MLRRIILTALTFALAASCLSACGDGVMPKEGSLKAPVSPEPLSPESLPTENMLKRSLRYEGDRSRFAQKIKAALDGDSVRIVFLGDSITQGSSASWDNQYVNRYAVWCRENIGQNVECINAGIGATDSYLGVHRVENDVLSHDPDIIFIEFVNDADSDFYKTAMESLVRRCLAHENNPAVVLIEMTQENGTCPQNVHSEVAEFYKIPMVSYHDAVLPEVEAGNLKWSDISPDNIHPNDAGHVMLSRLLEEFTLGVKDDIDKLKGAIKAFDTASESLMGDKYSEARLSGKDSPELTVVKNNGFEAQTVNDRFPDGWACENGGSITFEAEFSNLGLLYQKTVDGQSGVAKIVVDGIEIAHIDADFTGGWGSYAANDEILSLDIKKKHTVSISVSEGKRFEILRLMLS